jgi:DNA polymerase-3 subunit delta'
VDALLVRHRPELEPGERRTLVALAKGSIGQAIELADRGGVELHRALTGLLDALPVLDIPAAHALADQVGRSGDDAAASFRVIVQLMDDWIARRARSAAGSPEPWAEAAERVRRLAGATEGLNLDRKQAVLAALFAAQRAAGRASVPA